jgi:phage terminase small subunit
VGKEYKDRPLQPKQVAFKDAYLAQERGKKNPTQAALDAGYSTKSAAEQGRRLLLHPKMRHELMLHTPSRVREIANIDAAWVLKELAVLWDVPLSELFDDLGRLRPLTDIPEEAQKLISGFEVVEVQVHGEDGEPDTLIRTGKVKLFDRLRVLEDIGKLTRVNAFGTGNVADAADSVADLMRAMTKIASNPKSSTQVDITPTGETT